VVVTGTARLEVINAIRGQRNILFATYRDSLATWVSAQMPDATEDEIRIGMDASRDQRGK
jgi:hypothetical protein